MLSINLNPVPVIAIGKFMLRAIEPADHDALFALQSSPAVTKYLDRDPMQHRDELSVLLDKIAAALEQKSGITWVIADAETNACLGTVAYWRIDAQNHRAEIGYMLLEELHGRGIMTQLLPAFLDHGFRQFRFHSVEARANPGNTASIRLLERHGFEKEAHFKEDFYYNGRFVDTVVYSLLAATWETKPGIIR